MIKKKNKLIRWLLHFFRTYIFVFLLGIIVGVISTIMYVQKMYIPPTCEADNYVLEGWYYITSSISAIATAIAIATALFSKEIRQWFFSPSCEVTITDGGFREIQSQSPDGNIKVDSYSCDLKIKNAGNVEMEECELVLEEVAYKQNSNQKKWKKLSKSNGRRLYWDIPENYKITFPPKDSRFLPIVRIYPASSDTTPDNTQKSELKLQIMGCNLDDNYRNGGVWLMKYSVKSSTKILESFEVEVEWDGRWLDRLESMNLSATIN